MYRRSQNHSLSQLLSAIFQICRARPLRWGAEYLHHLEAAKNSEPLLSANRKHVQGLSFKILRSFRTKLSRILQKEGMRGSNESKARVFFVYLFVSRKSTPDSMIVYLGWWKVFFNLAQFWKELGLLHPVDKSLSRRNKCSSTDTFYQLDIISDLFAGYWVNYPLFDQLIRPGILSLLTFFTHIIS